MKINRKEMTLSHQKLKTHEIIYFDRNRKYLISNEALIQHLYLFRVASVFQLFEDKRLLSYGP